MTQTQVMILQSSFTLNFFSSSADQTKVGSNLCLPSYVAFS